MYKRQGFNRVTMTDNENGSCTFEGVSTGAVTVTATSVHNSSVKATYSFFVAVAVTEIWLEDRYVNYDSSTVHEGFDLVPTLTPENATFRNRYDYEWMSSDESVISIDEEGHCTVNGLGTAYISICCKYDPGYQNGSGPLVEGGCSITVLQSCLLYTSRCV